MNGIRQHWLDLNWLRPNWFRHCVMLVIVMMVSVCGFSQEIETFTVETGQFDKLKIEDDINVIYRCLADSTGFARYQGEKKFENFFNFKTKGDGTLRVSFANPYANNNFVPTLYVYSDFLISVENSSSASLSVENLEPCAEFKATQVGNGTISVDNIKANKVSAFLNTGKGNIFLSGSCLNATFKIVGTGQIGADLLKVQNVQCQTLGNGTIGCWVTESLTVNGLGSTKVYYKGHPSIKKAGTAKVFELPSEENKPEETSGQFIDKEEGVPVVQQPEDDDEEEDMEFETEEIEESRDIDSSVMNPGDNQESEEDVVDDSEDDD